jgi:hypothetical protein
MLSVRTLASCLSKLVLGKKLRIDPFRIFVLWNLPLNEEAIPALRKHDDSLN